MGEREREACTTHHTTKEPSMTCQRGFLVSQKIAAIFHLRQKIAIAIAEKSRHLVHSGLS